jgi:D-tyrosyl-tRNA(Tyr) deacylase
LVSQFTLFADVSRGRRPGFTDAAPPEQAMALVVRFGGRLRELGFEVAEGRFGAHMQVSLTNDGPFTIWLDSDN